MIEAMHMICRVAPRKFQTRVDSVVFISRSEAP